MALPGAALGNLSPKPTTAAATRTPAWSVPPARKVLPVLKGRRAPSALQARPARASLALPVSRVQPVPPVSGAQPGQPAPPEQLHEEPLAYPVQWVPLALKEQVEQQVS